ncbi:MAG: hypothetical protein ACPKOI_09320 [Pleomorphochaeta sp.]
MKNIKKLFFVILTLSTLLMTSCTDPLSIVGDNYDTVWISKNPEMSFTVPSENSDNCMFGTAKLDDGTEITFKLNGRGRMVHLSCIDENGKEVSPFLTCTGKIKENKFILKEIENDSFYNGKYDKITFVRQDLDEETSES